MRCFVRHNGFDGQFQAIRFRLDHLSTLLTIVAVKRRDRQSRHHMDGSARKACLLQCMLNDHAVQCRTRVFIELCGFAIHGADGIDGAARFVLENLLFVVTNPGDASRPHARP